jgi:hypothetical protein
VPCLEGAQLVQEIFEENKSETLRGAIIWTPMLQTDDLAYATMCEIIFSDARVKQFWVPGRIFGLSLARTLKLSILVAWDVYLLYPPEHPWEAELPPLPEFWMHQQDEEMSLYLDPAHLKQQVKALIERTTY